MVNPRQPIDSESEDMTKGRLNDSNIREASPTELDDEDLDTSQEDFEDADDLDY